MSRFCSTCLVFILVFGTSLSTVAQPFYRLPDKRSLKHITTKQSDHASDIPGKETIIDYYSAPNGQVITIYSYKGRSVAFSVHSNNDVQRTYRFFMDLRGDGNFQTVNAAAGWQLPSWAK